MLRRGWDRFVISWHGVRGGGGEGVGTSAVCPALHSKGPESSYDITYLNCAHLTYTCSFFVYVYRKEKEKEIQKESARE